MNISRLLVGAILLAPALAGCVSYEVPTRMETTKTVVDLVPTGLATTGVGVRDGALRIGLLQHSDVEYELVHTTWVEPRTSHIPYAMLAIAPALKGKKRANGTTAPVNPLAMLFIIPVLAVAELIDGAVWILSSGPMYTAYGFASIDPPALTERVTQTEGWRPDAGTAVTLRTGSSAPVDATVGHGGSVTVKLTGPAIAALRAGQDELVVTVALTDNAAISTQVTIPGRKLVQLAAPTIGTNAAQWDAITAALPAGATETRAAIAAVRGG